MQNFLEWLDDHELLDPLEMAMAFVGIILYGIWCLAIVVAGVIGIPLLAICLSAWWLLAYIPFLVLLVLTAMVYYYIDARQ